MADYSFWYNTLLYLYRPNLINKRLLGAKIIRIWICPENFELDDIVKELLKDDTTIKRLNSILKVCSKNSLSSNNFLLDQLLNQQQHSTNNRPILVLRKLFRKQSLKSLLMRSSSSCNNNNNNSNIDYDWVILLPTAHSFAVLPADGYDQLDAGDDDDDENSGHVHINIRKDDIAFALSLIDVSLEKFYLELRYLFDNQQQKQNQTITTWNQTNYWLENVFKPKFEKWIKSSKQEFNSLEDNIAKTETAFEGSIRNVSVENYCQNYNRLKEKYVSSLINIWSKVERTDPIKFIYEDVAIAAYLITLWKEEMDRFLMDRQPTFADIGCGNGLLVYILTKEGYQGYGVDIRKRNIWNFYGNDINLIEMRIDLFDYQTNDDFRLTPCDWMIGNHSDELTPWIIYMAASISPFTRAFILPCCCYDFDGFKFQRTTEPNKSQYQCYIDFLHRLCYQFGFKCFRDKLRIPSTKRICLVCYGRTYLDNGNLLANSNWQQQQQKNLTKEQTDQLRSIESEWKHKRRQIVQQSLNARSSYRHRLREKKETVRNCTRIDQTIKEEIINRLATMIFVKTNQSKSESFLSYQEAIHLLDNDIRKELKNQCGGLQTFIRNHKHIFTIDNNVIRFQRAEYLRRNENDKNIKTKQCWFYRNHPNGCPLGQEECGFKHDD